jgi:hypothetical protein
VLAGATVGAVYEGARMPMLEGEVTEDDGVVLGLQGEQSGTPLRHEISTDEGHVGPQIGEPRHGERRG